MAVKARLLVMHDKWILKVTLNGNAKCVSVIRDVSETFREKTEWDWGIPLYQFYFLLSLFDS